MSQEFSRMENRILCALARLDDFVIDPLLQGYSGTTPETSRNMFSTNQGTIEDDSQSNPHPEAGLLTSGREDRHAMLKGVQRERERERESVDGCDMVTEATGRRDMVTGATERCDMVTGVHEEVTYCSHSTSSGKQKRNRSTGQPQFRSENTPATNEADQILLPLQQLANNSTSANFRNNNNSISQMPKSLTTTMLTFDG